MQCGTFGIVSQLLISWEQGDLGVILSGVALLVGAGISIKTQDLQFVIFAIALSIALFFFPYFVQGITGIPVDQCAEQLQQQRAITRDLSSCSAQIPSYSGQGQSCFCAAMDAVPVCASTPTSPLPAPGPGVSGTPIIYRNGQFSGGPETWHYTQAGTTVTYTLYGHGQCETEYLDNHIEGEYCE